MALRNILLEGDETLRKKSKDVVNFGERNNLLLDDMWETMRSADGIGLAAPQVGVLRRVVIIDVTPPPVDANSDDLEISHDNEDVEEQMQFELINPEIIEQSGENIESEGCLSLPGVIGMVPRPEYVRVKAYDRKGEEIIIEGEGLLAKAICHEIDHLNGILFTDIAESINEGE